MNLSPFHWLIGIVFAASAHALIFAAMGTYEKPVLIARSAGLVISTAGSLAEFSTTANTAQPDILEQVEKSEPIEGLKPETVRQERPQEILKTHSGKAEPMNTAQAIAALEPAPAKIDQPDQAKAILPIKSVKPVKATKKTKIKHRKKPRKTHQKPLNKRTKTTSKTAKKNKHARRGGSRTKSGRRGGGGGGRQSAVAGAAALSNYKGRVYARISGRARAARGRGTVIVKFTITSGGGVSNIRILRGRNAHLNKMALRAVKGGFPPIPSGGPKSLTFTIPLTFR